MVREETGWVDGQWLATEGPADPAEEQDLMESDTSEWWHWRATFNLSLKLSLIS